MSCNVLHASESTVLAYYKSVYYYLTVVEYVFTTGYSVPESVAGICFTATHVETHLLREIPLFLEEVLEPLGHFGQLLKATHPRLNVVKVDLPTSHDSNSWQDHSLKAASDSQIFQVSCLSTR